MTSLRDARAAAIRTSVGRGLAWSLDSVLPLLLDDLDAIDREQVPGPIRVDLDAEITEEQAAELRRQLDEAVMAQSAAVPTDDQLAAWVERNPKAFADWAAKQARISGAAPTRRRTAR